MNDFLTLGPDGRVAEHEGKTLDYKRDLSGPEGVLRTVVAFANSAGGRLVIGVVDDRSVVGVDDPVTAEMRLADLIADSIRPQLLPTIELITLDGRTVLVANVPVGGQRPYYLKEAGRYGGAYVRLGSSNRRATRLLTDDLARGGGGLADLRSADQPAGRYRRHRPAGAGAASRPAHRRGGTAHPGTGRTRERTSAPDPEWNWRRRDVSSIPEAAIRKLVVNALVHSSLLLRRHRHQGGFLRPGHRRREHRRARAGVTIEQITHGVSVQRNPALARVFREAGIMKQWGTGVQRVFEQVAEAGLPEPLIEEVPDQVRVTIYVPSHDPARPLKTRARAARRAPPPDLTILE